MNTKGPSRYLTGGPSSFRAYIAHMASLANDSLTFENHRPIDDEGICRERHHRTGLEYQRHTVGHDGYGLLDILKGIVGRAVSRIDITDKSYSTLRGYAGAMFLRDVIVDVIAGVPATSPDSWFSWHTY